ncbi:hypothetical protein [Alcanivorax sp. 1008]|uniref:hypothetical protein n=1 Tax=Alcanivorax sp. 1008 TaxID=2816853 RepID=UPI001D581894|nr:hypothetical protein [Alcanivorax sp. 1008]MCC1498116.1 hypothetical protein [Alcanivorax sp. 1008]
MKVFQEDGSTLLETSDTGADGAIEISYSGDYSGPLIVVVEGDADAEYFDEASSSMIAFGPGKSIHAIVPAGSTEVTVTALTEIAYQIALLNDLVLTDTVINQINEVVRLALAPELSSILLPPTLFDSSTTTGSFGTTEADKYALRLAALAQLGSADAAPALTMAEQLAQDLSDGTIDGLQDGVAIVGLVYSVANFVTDLQTQLTAMATSFGTSALQTAVTSYTAVSTTVDLSGLVSSLVPDGDGMALSDGNGATGTVGETTYTFTGSIGDGPLYIYAPITGVGLFTSYNGSDPITRWTISGLSDSPGTYSCGADGELPSVSLTLSGVPYLADDCSIEIISVSTTEVEGRFAAHLLGTSDNEFGTVTDGYFRYETPSTGGGGLAEGEYGYSMDVDGENVTVTGVPALDGFDRQVAGFLTLGDTPTFQIRMIPDNSTGTYTCGEGPNSFRLVGMSYAGGTSENSSGSCTVNVTSAGAVYEGTFSGTLYTAGGTAIAITNGFFRNDGSEL